MKQKAEGDIIMNGIDLFLIQYGLAAIFVILIALVLGGLIQFVLARGPGRGLLYRLGRYIGLTSPLLDAASNKVKKGGVFGISLAILVPGVRGAAIAASGLANMPLRTFVAGLVVGSAFFLGLHFFLGYLRGTLFSMIGLVLPLAKLILVALALFVIAFALWVIAYRRQKAARLALEGAPLELWNEGICPVCLAVYITNQLRSPLVGQEYIMKNE
jgi:membrane protein DedA with SNARE-associated domain